MIAFYFKAAFRSFKRDGGSFFFKLGGFTLALISTFVIVVYINFHFSFDNFHADVKNIYRVNTGWMEEKEFARYAIAPPGIGPVLKDEFPEVHASARVRDPGQYLIRTENQSYRIYGITAADSTVFDVLTFKFMTGTKQALAGPRSIILTASLARQLYGNSDAIGKLVYFVDRDDAMFEVTGVVEDLPVNSHLPIRAIVSFQALRDSTEQAIDPWDINVDASSYLYVKLTDGAQPEALTSKVNSFVQSRLKRREDGIEKTFQAALQPLATIHLSAPLSMEFCRKVNMLYIYTFGTLAVFLLTMACTNYINLSIVGFQKRVKEITVRKILGAARQEISFQLILETFLFCLFAVICSVGTLVFVFPNVFRALNPDLHWEMIFQPRALLFIGLIVGVLLLASVVYPIYQLSMNGLIESIRNKKKNSGTSVFNTGLLFVQYVISVLAICATLVVGRQLDFVQTKDPGYDRDNIALLYMPELYPPEKVPVLRQELSAVRGVASVSYATFVIAGGDYFKDWYRVEIDGKMQPILLNELFMDYDFFRTVGMEVVAGRGFDVENSTDPHSAFIVNETAVKQFGWKDPIGMKMAYGYGEATGEEKWEGTVVGVVKDVNIRSLYEKVEPMVLRLPWSDWPGQCLYVRMEGDTRQTLEAVKHKYEEVLPGFPIDYRMLEDAYDKQYGEESRAFDILTWSTWVIVLISAIGIFSLSLFMTMKRMKEFGVRKMLGATTAQITLLHVGYFVRVMLFANVIGLPLAYLLTQEWLTGFAYKGDVSVLLYVLVLVISVALVVLSAGYSSLKSGRMNPLDVIKRV